MLPSLSAGLAFVDILNPQSPESLRSTLLSGHVVRLFDQSLKSYILGLYHPSSLETPSKPSLALLHPYLILQLFISKGKSFTIEFAFVDHSNTKRRVVFAYTTKVVRNPLHVRLPAEGIRREVWVNLCVDVVGLAQACFPRETFKHLDQIRLTSVCKVRRAFCTKLRPLDASSFPDAPRHPYDPVPPACEFPKTVTSVNQFLTYQSVVPEYPSKSLSPPKLPSLRLPSHKATRSHIPSPSKKLQSTRSPKKFIVELQREPPSSDVNRFRSAAPSPRTSYDPIDESPSLGRRPEVSPEQMYPGDTFENDTEEGSPKHPPDLPDFFSESLRQAIDIRHFTPPFVNVATDMKSQVYHYDPVSRAYAPNLKD